LIRLSDFAEGAVDMVIEKYLAMRVPRYTSYPTAPHFSGAVGERELTGWLERLPLDRPVSLYLHIPFCERMCWYCGCNMRLVARYDPIAEYVEHLLQEINRVAARLPGRMTVGHIHWGGGTPNSLSPDDFLRIDAKLRQHFEISEGAEIAVEIDPRSLKERAAAALVEIGCNRISVGVQEFDPEVQRAINRLQPFELVAATTGELRSEGIPAINFDLMYGLPHQTAEKLVETVDKAVSLKPDRVALFGYAHVPWMAKRQTMLDEAKLPGARARFEQAAQASARLVKHGYVAIGIDHFARTDDPLAKALKQGRLHRNFQGYTDDAAETLIGFGASAISRYPEGYAQNITQSGAYVNEVAAGRLPVARGLVLKWQDRLRRAIIEELMCRFSVDIAAACSAFGVPVNSLLPAYSRLESMVADGLVEWRGSTLMMTELGRPLARIAASAFDEYFSPVQQSKPAHAMI
jgi:oxygen-independent coproporphyrinogen-3 oxidase